MKKITKKIRDLTLADMPHCWDELFEINPAFMGLFTEDERRFNLFKTSIPGDILDMEIEYEVGE